MFFVFKNFFGNVVAIRNVKVNCYEFIIAYLQRKSMGVVSGFLFLQEFEVLSSLPVVLLSDPLPHVFRTIVCAAFLGSFALLELFVILKHLVQFHVP